MPVPPAELLDPWKARIFRIVHRDNLPAILRQGLVCPNRAEEGAEWVSIGNPDVIGRRRSKTVTTAPGGVLADYIPFYFTPWSVMLFNIITGRSVPKRNRDEILFLVSSLSRVQEVGGQAVFSDIHALREGARFYSDLADLSRVDFDLLKTRDFRRDPDDPGRFDRYQAEALVHDALPLNGLLGLACYTEATKQEVDRLVAEAKAALTVAVRPDWYFE